MTAYVILFLSSMIAFALASRGLIMALTQNVRLDAMVGEFTIKALKIGKAYKVGAWFLLTLVFFVWLVQSFIVVFFTL